MSEQKKRGWIIPLVILGLIIAGFVAGWFVLRTWPLRFHGALDQFFGAGNWEAVSEETKRSMMFEEYRAIRRAAAQSGSTDGRFHEWGISFTNRGGEPELWTISDHTLKINNHDHWFPLDPDRYTAKQALGQELMELAFDMAGEEVRENILGDILTESERDCLDVEVSFHGGRPDGKLYTELLAEPWFNIQELDAEKFLQSDLYDFYIDVFAYDYRVDDLSEMEQEHLFRSMGDIKQALRGAFGEYADYDIYLGEGYSAEYTGPKG